MSRINNLTPGTMRIERLLRKDHSSWNVEREIEGTRLRQKPGEEVTGAAQTRNKGHLGTGW